MTDPLQRIARENPTDGTLFTADKLPSARVKDTSTLAGEQAARKSGSMRIRIVERLRRSPAALFEVAADLGVPDHVISGRFTELARDCVIERTGVRRMHPVSECEAEVWRISRDARDTSSLATSNSQLETNSLLDKLGYPLTLIIDGDPHDRQELLPSESLPGIPYARRGDTGAVRLIVRVELLECPGCGHTLKLVIDQTSGSEKPLRTYQCGTQGCHRIWHPAMVSEPGKPQTLSLIARTS